LRGAPDFQHQKRVEGHARSPGIRLGRGIRLSSLNLHPKPTTRGLVNIREHPWVLGQATGILTQNSPRPGLEGSHHLPPYSILCSSPPRPHPNGSFSRDSQVGVPKLSRIGVPRLWMIIAPRLELKSGRGLNQSCSSRQELCNAVSHSLRRRWEEVYSRLLVVGSQTSSLTPDPSFAHNLGCKCPNGQCETILGIYASRSFH